MTSRKILGVRVDFDLGMGGVIDIIENKFLKDEKNHLICTTNPEFIIDAQTDEEFKKIINESSISTPDGVGVLYAKKYLEKIEKFRKNIFFPVRALMSGIGVGLSSFIPSKNMKNEKVTGVDLTYEICELSSKKGYSVFFLGGRQKTPLGKLSDEIDNDMSIAAAKKMREMYPNVNIIGATSKFSRDVKDDVQTIDYIKNCMKDKGINKIDFLFVAYNHIHQEKWIMRNKDKISAKVSIGCGGTFDFIVGNCTPPPNIYAKYNLGWLYRLLKQPWRLKRTIKAFPVFPMKVYAYSICSMRRMSS